MTPALAIDGLQFGYGARPVVRGVSLRLWPGDCYGFLGHNGAGKTTVMRLCLGLLGPRSGGVQIFGLDARRHRREANALLGAVVEQTGFHLHGTARWNLMVLARLQGMARRLAAAEAARVLEVMGLAAAADQRVGTFSLGMRQRLGIAQALLGRPRLLLLDEPTSGLDPEGIAELRALLLQLTRNEGTAVLLSSHQLAELDGLCTRIGVLRDGEMVVEGDLEALRQRIGTRHVVAGPSLSALAGELRALGLAPVDGDRRLLVELGDRPPAGVLRALLARHDVTAFAPEPPTLERIYLGANRDGASAAVAAPAVPVAAPAVPVAAPAVPVAALGSAAQPWRRAFRFEAAVLGRRRASGWLLLLPAVAGSFGVWHHARRAAAAGELVSAGTRFSADTGSGFLATVRGLGLGVPALALVLLWLASQAVAADCAGDTLRNTLVRGVRRSDVAFGKLGVLLAAGLAGFLLLVAATLATAAQLVGFGDLHEVTRHGDRELLAAAADVAPALRLALVQLALPLAAVVAVALSASALARRPARALALGFGLVLGPELLRDALGERAGWLLTSHLPTALRDDSALAFAAAVARGAADAAWTWSDQAVVAPLVWLLAGTLVTGLVFARLRVA